MAFNTKRPLNDTKYIQGAGETLNLSGDTNIGYGEYLTDKSGVYVARSLVDAEYVTGQTSGKTDCTDFNSYTGTTNTRLNNIEGDITTISGDVITNANDIITVSGLTVVNADDITTISGDVITNANNITNLGALSGITEVSITAVTNGLTKVGSHSAKLGGDLNENTSLNGLGNSFILNSLNQFTLTYSGSSVITDNQGTPTGLLYAADYSAGFLDNSLVTKCYVDNAAGAISASNGLTRVDNNITLGGALTGNTCVTTVANSISFGIAPTIFTGADSVVLASGSVSGACAVAMANGFAGGAKSIAFSDGEAAGDGSFAFGLNSIAHSNNSAAFGGNAHACATGSFAFGKNVTTSGVYSQAFGSGSTATGIASFAIGADACATGNESVSFGGGYASGLGAWARGAGACATGNFSTAIGAGVASGIGSQAIGRCNTACGTNSIAMGKYAYASGNNSFAFGTGLDNTKRIVASGTSSINFSTNDVNQNDGHGADADYSTILGGVNHHIEQGNLGASIIGRHGSTGIELTGSSYTDNVVVSNLAIWNAPTDDSNGEVLVWDSATKKVGKTTIASLGGITGATNGTQTIGQDIGLGGILTEASTVISGANKNYTFGTVASPINLYTQNSSCHIVSADACAYFRTEGASGSLVVDAQNQGQVVIKSQVGTTVGSAIGSDALGFSLSYQGNIFKVIDNRVGSNQSGIAYQSDYSANYLDRSLVDKAYVDSVAAGLDAKDAVNIATTTSDGDIDVTGGTFVSGTTLDGVVVDDGWRVLVKNQTDAIENGIWLYSASTSAFTRTIDFDGNPTGEVSNGAYTLVITGDTLINTQWVVTTPDPIDVDVTDINWSLLSQQIGIQAGTGITITTLNSNNTISTKLATIDSAMCYDGGLGLSVDQSIAGSGLTMTAGVIDVCANVGGVTTEIDVYFGANNNLVVREEDFSFTTAANGLTKNGSVISLGGALTGNTNIDGTASCYDFTFTCIGTFDIAFDSGSTITDTSGTGGLHYATDYSSNFVARSLVDAAYVTGLTSVNTTSANNGLTKEGNGNIKLGGTLTGDTCVNTSGNGIIFGTNSATAAGADAVAIGNATSASGANSLAQGNSTSAIGANSHASGFISQSCGTTTFASGTGLVSCEIKACGNNAFIHSRNTAAQTAGHGALANDSVILGGQNHNIEIGNTGAVILGGDAIKLTGTDYIDYVAVDNLAIFTAPVDGVFSDGVLVWDSADNKVKQVASTVIGGITGASNGLNVVAKEVLLGGPLTEATTITIGSQSLTITSKPIQYTADYSSQYNALSIPDAGFVTGLTDTLVTCTDFNSYTGITDTRITNIETDVTTISGDVITNANDIITNANNITTISGDVITNANNITNLGNISGITNASITGVTNGLTKVGSHSANLGGILTQDTTILGSSGTYDLTFSGIDNYLTSADTLDLVSPAGSDSGYLNMTGTTVVLGQTISTVDFKIDITSGVGTVTDAINSKGLNYAACYHTNYGLRTLVDREYVDNATGAISATNGLTRVDDNITLGGDLTGDTTVGLAGFGLALGSGSTIANTITINNLAIQDSPAAGDAVADAILVWDNADKLVKQVAASALGEDNNIYSYESGDTTINLSTSSPYMILVDTTTFASTINLPASPLDGQAFKIKDKAGNALNNIITVDSGGGNNIDDAQTASINTNYGALEIAYSLEDDNWFTLAFIN